MTQLKKPTTYQEQLDILRNRNIIIDDPARCTMVLESVNYYRFTAYFLPFKQKDGTYRDGTRFQRVYRIYEFDRKLRSVLFSALEEVEVYLRAKFAYFHAHKYGAEGYMDTANYSSHHQAEKFKGNLAREIASNKRSAFVIHHNEHYDGHFPI
nr:MAG TPA: Abi-like protein [Caudoviricetes sp.]